MNNAKKMDSVSPKPKAFLIVRKNALANPNLYGGRYSQKDVRKAYREWENDMKFMEENHD